MTISARIAAAKQHPLTTLQNLWVRLLAATPLRRVIVIPIHGGYKIHLDSSALARVYYFNPDERSGDFEVLRLILRSGDHYVDVGANIGSTAIPAAGCVGSTGSVWAFEAHPRTAQYLADNVRLNRLANVRIHAVAVDREPGMVWISDKDSDDQNDISVEHKDRGLPVAAVRLDDVIPADLSIALLKIDVEGAEVRVLGGAQRTLASCRAVYFEASERMLQRFGSSVGELFRALECAGFNVFRLRAQVALTPVDPAQVSKLDHVNLLAIKDVPMFLSRTGLALGNA